MSARSNGLNRLTGTAAEAVKTAEATSAQHTGLKRGVNGSCEKRSCVQSRTGRAALRGFTLIELLLVLAILGILAAIVVPKMAGRSEDARRQAAATQISAFKTALNTFEVDNGGYPRGQAGLADLIQAPRDAQNWKGPYLDTDAVPKDPWGRDYLYVCPGKNGSFDISSAGPDGQPGNDDDITSWTRK